MEIERDLSDLGVCDFGDPDAPPVDLVALEAPAAPPPPPASEGVRSGVRAGLAQSQGWKRQVSPALSGSCQCGASPGGWCRRAGRLVVGFVHPSRETATPV